MTFLRNLARPRVPRFTRHLSSKVSISVVPALADNYAFTVNAGRDTIVVDSPEFEPIANHLKANDWKLTHIFNTHDHFDHVQANEMLKNAFDGTQVVGRPEFADANVTIATGPADFVTVGDLEFQVLDLGGHTKNQIGYYLAQEDAVFVGDCLFTLGCGRVFSGTVEQHFESMCTLMALPDQTKVYGAHEYTLANAAFALSVDPFNRELQSRVKLLEAQRERGLPTVPTTIGEEKSTNPFFRFQDEGLRRSLGEEFLRASNVEVFRELRARKDRF